jgi:hypothetical protein
MWSLTTESSSGESSSANQLRSSSIETQFGIAPRPQIRLSQSELAACATRAGFDAVSRVALLRPRELISR